MELPGSQMENRHHGSIGMGLGMPQTDFLNKKVWLLNYFPFVGGFRRCFSRAHPGCCFLTRTTDSAEPDEDGAAKLRILPAKLVLRVVK